MMRIFWSPRALRRVEIITDYIREDNPRAAEDWALKLFELAQSLELMPGRGRKVPEAQDELILEVFLGDYRLIYRIDYDRDEVGILYVQHGARLLPIDEVLAPEDE